MRNALQILSALIFSLTFMQPAVASTFSLEIIEDSEYLIDEELGIVEFGGDIETSKSKTALKMFRNSDLPKAKGMQPIFENPSIPSAVLQAHFRTRLLREKSALPGLVLERNSLKKTGK